MKVAIFESDGTLRERAEDDTFAPSMVDAKLIIRRQCRGTAHHPRLELVDIIISGSTRPITAFVLARQF